MLHRNFESAQKRCGIPLQGSDSLTNLSFRVEGTPELLALVRERFGEEDIASMNLTATSSKVPPCAFLSYAWEDHELAERLAKALMQNGIDTWWAEWSMKAGHSLRQKIDQGLGDCTHFLVLLTPTSIGKPWVNQEMDAGLVRKLESETRFFAIRAGLPASQLPPLLKGLLSPSLEDFNADVRQIIADIHELSRKPRLGLALAATSAPTTGYSTAATTVARIFIDRSENAVLADPQLTVEEIAEATSLTDHDVQDALHELSAFFNVILGRALPKDELFASFDRHFKEWDPAADALTLAADLVNNPAFPRGPAESWSRYGWPPRRLNPAIAYLVNRDIITESKAIGSHPWTTAWVDNTDATRRFVKRASASAGPLKD
jgi:hypothetical protein